MNYLVRFESYVNSELNLSEREICNNILCKLSYLFSSDIKVIFALYAIITWLLIITYLYKNRYIAYLPITVIASLSLMYAESYNIIRQSIAVAIIVYSIRYIQERNLWKFLLCVIIAYGFHNTAIVAILLYSINISRTQSFKGYSKVVILIPIAIPLLLGVVSAIPVFSYYFDNYESSNTSAAELFILKLPVYLPLLFYRKRIRTIPGADIFYYCLLFELSFGVVALYYKWAFRIVYYFIIGQIMLAGILVNSFKDYRSRFFMAVYFIIYYILIFYIEYILWGWSGIYPYNSFATNPVNYII